jgi:hypothetical protein
MMKHRVKIVSILLALLAISACGNDSGDKASPAKSTVITGLASSRDGVIASGQVDVKTLSGQQVAKAQLNTNGEFKVTIPGGTSFPILLTVQDEDELLEAVVMSPLAQKQDISDMSTLVVQSARDLGGINKENMARAAINAIRQNKKSSGSGTSAGFKGDPTKQYGGWH